MLHKIRRIINSTAVSINNTSNFDAYYSCDGSKFSAFEMKSNYSPAKTWDDILCKCGLLYHKFWHFPIQLINNFRLMKGGQF